MNEVFERFDVMISPYGRTSFIGLVSGALINIITHNTGWLCTFPKTHKMFKRTLFNQTKQDRMRMFKEILFFNVLVLVLLAGGLRKEGRRSCK